MFYITSSHDINICFTNINNWVICKTLDITQLIDDIHMDTVFQNVHIVFYNLTHIVHITNIFIYTKHVSISLPISYP